MDRIPAAATPPLPPQGSSLATEDRAAISPGSGQERPERRQVSWLAGRHAMHAFPAALATSGRPHHGAGASRSPLTVAGTAADLAGCPAAPHSLLCPKAPARSSGEVETPPADRHTRRRAAVKCRRAPVARRSPANARPYNRRTDAAGSRRDARRRRRARSRQGRRRSRGAPRAAASTTPG